MKSGLLAMIALFSITLHAQTLDELSFISGYWTSTEGGAVIEEMWTDQSGGLMVGMHKDVYPNGRSSFEFLRIVQTADGPVYLASPGGQEPTPFPLKSVENQTAVFENPDHDFPVRIIYKLVGDSMHVRIENAEGDRGMEWVWTRTKFNF